MTDYSHLTSVEQMQFDLFSTIVKGFSNRERPVMIELGCAEALYSKRFNEILKGVCVNLCVELKKSCLENAKNNLPEASFFHGVVGQAVHIQEAVPSASEFEGATTIPMKSLFNIPDDGIVDILHMDIQGSEVSVLKEMKDNDLFGRVRFIFCSLHGTYQECKDILDSCGHPVHYIWSHPTQGGYGDGLIVCQLGTHEQ